MQTILLQLARLRRHYNASVRSYDDVSLLDLSHILRIWAEMKPVLPGKAPRFGTTLAFKTAIPAKKVLRKVRGTEFVFSYMPGGVITYAGNGAVVGGPEVGENYRYAIRARVGLKLDGALELGQYSVVTVDLDGPTEKALDAEDQTRCNYSQWMAAEVVRVSYPTEAGALEQVVLTRETIVKRVANTLDGSHPSAAATISDGNNSFDPAVHYLLRYQMGGLPLPYFILLKIAQDILSVAPRLLGIDPAGAQSDPCE